MVTRVVKVRGAVESLRRDGRIEGWKTEGRNGNEEEEEERTKGREGTERKMIKVMDSS